MAPSGKSTGVGAWDLLLVPLLPLTSYVTSDKSFLPSFCKTVGRFFPAFVFICLLFECLGRVKKCFEVYQNNHQYQLVEGDVPGSPWQDGEKTEFQPQTSFSLNVDSILTGCVALGKLLNPFPVF